MNIKRWTLATWKRYRQQMQRAKLREEALRKREAEEEDGYYAPRRWSRKKYHSPPSRKLHLNR